MIDVCASEIAAWSPAGDTFVVKNVEKFASDVIPMYFKHSNFSSFQRQLNMYGFKRISSDPILTSDINPETAGHVRFYHENFQRNKPDLLHLIKRASKTDQQSSKDDVETLKQELAKLRNELATASEENDLKMAELRHECNRKIAAMNAEYDKLALLVHRYVGAVISAPHTTLASVAAAANGVASALPDSNRVPTLLQTLSQATMAMPTHFGGIGTERKRSLSYLDRDPKRCKTF